MHKRPAGLSLPPRPRFPPASALPPPRPRAPPHRYQALADQLAQALRDGRYPAGTRLPAIRELCETHRASLATVTHALHRLEDAGLIEARPRQGFFACALPMTRAIKHASVDAEALDARRARLLELAAARAGQLSLGHLALPTALLPLAVLARLTRQQLLGSTAALADATTFGSIELRQAVAGRLVRQGCAVDAEDLVITSGESDSLQLCLGLLAPPSARVAVTRPVPFRLLELMSARGLEVVELPIAADGHQVVAALEAALAAGPQPLAACMVNDALSIAAGTAWSDDARRALVALCTRHGLPLVEYDLFTELPLGAEAPRLFKSFDTDDRVLHCGSLSCVTGIGMSVGWIASGRHRLQLRAARAVHGDLLPGLADRVLAAFMASEDYDRHLRRLRRRLAQQLAAWRAAITAAFPPGTEVGTSPSGYQFWLRLPGGRDAAELLGRARQHGLGFVPGAVFTLGTELDHCLRLTAGHALDKERLAALQLLGKLARAGKRPQRAR